MSIFNSTLKPDEIFSALKDVEKTLHFIGIMGSGMYPLAKMLKKRGYRVSGSDDAVRVEFYRDECDILIRAPQHALGNEVGLVIYSLAIDETNTEIAYAKAHGIPLISRAQLLGALMSQSMIRVSVSGSHGKSTTTALLDHIFTVSDIGHTTVCGAKLSCGEAYSDSGRDLFIAEACEYKDSFLCLPTTHQIITSVELDHTDYFRDMAHISSSFLSAAKSAGVALVNCDDSGALSVAVGAGATCAENGNTILTYGSSDRADYRLTSIVSRGDVADFEVCKGERKFSLSTSLIGKFNLYNITAAVAMADVLGVSKENIESAVRSFTPIDRRMMLISAVDGIPIYYDYAHHPSEIDAVITALKEKYGAVSVIFRPHTYSRTKSLWDDFINALNKADFTVLLDIYPAREKPIEGVNSKKLASSINNCLYATLDEAAYIALSRPTGAIALLGAGEVDTVRRDLIELGKATGYYPERR